MALKIIKEQSGIKYIVAIAAGKGGVGKSTVTVNLALALKQLGYQVGILDTDLYGPSIKKMLTHDQLPSQRGQTIYPAVCQGIKTLSMGFVHQDDSAAVVRAPIANGIINQFIQNASWGDLDFLLVDFPPGTGDIQLTLCQKANLSGAILVTTPQEVALMDVRKAGDLFAQMNIPVVGIIENLSYYINSNTNDLVYLFGKGGGNRLASERNVPLLGQIPVDPILSEYGDLGASIFENDKANHLAEIFFDMAGKLIGFLEKKENSKQFEIVWRKMGRQAAPQFDKMKSATKRDIPEELSIQSIVQKDDVTFCILWNDQSIADYNLSYLQQHCPCAQCLQNKIEGRKSFSEHYVEATRIYNVGRYALGIQFTSGCSAGIYDLNLLYQLGNKE